MLTNFYVKQLINYNRKMFARNLFAPANFSSKKITFNERKLIGFSAEQMYSVVSDVANYKKFVPFCRKSQVILTKPDFIKANLIIGFPPIIESYTSNIYLEKPYAVKVICKDGRLFNHLDTIWQFSPALKTNAQSCIIDFNISFEFRSILYSRLAHFFFESLVQQMEDAFMNEAKVRYGKESLPPKRLTVVNIKN